MVPIAWVHPLLASGRCLVERATQWFSLVSFQEQVFPREQDISKWAHRPADNVAASSLISMLKNTSICPGWNQLSAVFQGSFTLSRGEEKDVHVSKNLHDKWRVTTTKESTAAPTDSWPLCSSSQYRHLQSGREKGQGHSYLKQKSVPALMPLVKNFPTPDISCPSLLAAASLFLPTLIFWNSTFKESLVRGWWLWPGALWPAGFRVRHARLHQFCRTSLQLDFLVCWADQNWLIWRSSVDLQRGKPMIWVQSEIRLAPP